MARTPKAVCRVCEQPIWVKQIAEQRKDMPSGRITYMCVECKQEQLRQHIRDTRQWMGLPPLENQRS